jgi:hypothetical protein
MTVVSVVVTVQHVLTVHFQLGMMINIVIHQTTLQSVDMMVVTAVRAIVQKVVQITQVPTLVKPMVVTA